MGQSNGSQSSMVDAFSSGQRQRHLLRVNRGRYSVPPVTFAAQAHQQKAGGIVFVTVDAVKALSSRKVAVLFATRW